MKLEFDTITELEQFLLFSAHIGKVFAPAPAMELPQSEGSRADAQAEEAELPLAEVSQKLEQMFEDVRAGGDDAAAADPVTEAPKRKRRTKAEIEAEKYAENVAAEHSLAITSTTNGNGSSATETVAAISVGTNNPFAQPETVAQTAQVTAPRVVESIDHLRACQSFIQQHGMALYNESFRDGLNANIAAYTPDQRSQHVGILESLGA